MILAFKNEIFALLDADVSHGLLGLEPLVALDLTFETLDVPVSLPTLDLFLEVVHPSGISARGLFRSNVSGDKSIRCYESSR